MKLRLTLIAIMLGVIVAPAHGQANCMYVSATTSGDVRVYDPTNEYIASETVTWAVTCKNTSSGASTSYSNPVTATGGGGWKNGTPSAPAIPSFPIQSGTRPQLPQPTTF
jgi:hypothetical protein